MVEHPALAICLWRCGVLKVPPAITCMAKPLSVHRGPVSRDCYRLGTDSRPLRHAQYEICLLGFVLDLHQASLLCLTKVADRIELKTYD